MTNASCIFCRIIAKEVPSAIIKENEHAVALRDIAPKAPTHYLLIPKQHITSVASVTDEQLPAVAQLMALARDIATEANLTGFNLIANNGASAGQSVHHLHFHFLAGKNIYDGGLKL